jgi:hypothetical protein
MDRSAYPETETSIIFALSRAKVIRAKGLITELEADAADYLATRPLTAWFQPDGTVNVHYEAVTLKPAMIVGDCIHCLRSALDLMASELARINGKSDKSVYFPFSNEADGLDEQIKARHFNRAGDDAVALLKTFQPYRGGNMALRAIHDFDILDKHSGIVLSGNQRQFRLEAMLNLQTGENSIAVHDTTMRYVFPTTIPDFAEKDVVETLQRFVELIEGILEAFAALVAART